MTFTVLDGILAGIVLICLIIGYIKGFFAVVTVPIKIIGAGCLTFCIASPIIDGWTRPFFTEQAYGWINNTLIEKCPEITGASAKDSLPLVLKLTAGMFDIDVAAFGEDATTADLISEISTALSLPIGNVIATAVTYVALFILILIVLSILTAIIGGVIDSGPLMVVDRTLGVLLGGAISIVICCIVANVTVAISSDFAGGFVFEFFKNFDPFSLVLSV